jgi:hypothetical protein
MSRLATRQMSILGITDQGYRVVADPQAIQRKKTLPSLLSIPFAAFAKHCMSVSVWWKTRHLQPECCSSQGDHADSTGTCGAKSIFARHDVVIYLI